MLKRDFNLVLAVGLSVLLKHSPVGSPWTGIICRLSVENQPLSISSGVLWPAVANTASLGEGCKTSSFFLHMFQLPILHVLTVASICLTLFADLHNFMIICHNLSPSWHILANRRWLLQSFSWINSTAIVAKLHVRFCFYLKYWGFPWRYGMKCWCYWRFVVVLWQDQGLATGSLCYNTHLCIEALSYQSQKSGS